MSERDPQMESVDAAADAAALESAFRARPLFEGRGAAAQREPRFFDIRKLQAQLVAARARITALGG